MKASKILAVAAFLAIAGINLSAQPNQQNQGDRKQTQKREHLQLRQDSTGNKNCDKEVPDRLQERKHDRKQDQLNKPNQNNQNQGGKRSQRGK